MLRRDFIALLGGAAAARPLSAHAQQVDRLQRVGILMAYAESDADAQIRVKAFTQALQKLGWTNGHNIRIESRWAETDADRFRSYAAELVESQCDVILAATTPAVAALQRATHSIPVVFVMVSDPEGSGVVKSLARPGGNVTGLTNFEPSMGGKWLQLVKEIAPRVERVAFIFHPERFPAGGKNFLRSLETAAHSSATGFVAAPVHDPTAIEDTMTGLGRGPAGALVVAPDSFTVVYRDLIVALAARHRLPVVYPYRFFVTAGGLISYGTDPTDLHRQVATYVDLILRGKRVEELPVQGPTKFELAVNLKTARALGLEVPPSLLVRADEVIE